MIGEVPEPAQSSDRVTFLWSARGHVAGLFTIGLIGAVVANVVLFALFSLAARRMAIPSASFVLVQCLAHSMCFAGSSLLFTRTRPPWLRTSDAGLEVAATRTDPIFLPWSVIASVRIRWRGPLAFVEITPTDPALVLRGRCGGWNPRQRRRAGLVSFTADIGSLRPGRSAIQTELVRRGCTIRD